MLVLFGPCENILNLFIAMINCLFLIEDANI